MVVLIELAEQLAAENVGMSLRWIPRLQNEEADALTNGVFTSFDMRHRIVASVSEMPFKVMGSLMSQVSVLMSEINVLKSSVPELSRTPCAKKLKLRESDSW